MKFAQMLLRLSLGLLTPALMMSEPIRAIALPSGSAMSSPQIKVPGTAVSITPPEGFKASKLFTGFEQPQSGASLMVTEMPIPQKAHPKVIEQLSSADLLKSKGMRLISGQDTMIDGHQGRLILVSQLQEIQGTKFLKWIAVVAKGDHILMVVAPFPESQTQKLREPLRQAILGLKWQPVAQNTSSDGLPFVFQEQGDLKIAARLSNTVLLTKNAAQPPLPDSEPFLVVGVAYQEVQIPDIAQFARARLKQMREVRELTEVSGERKTIAGQKAFEIVAQGYDLKTKIPLTIYQTIIVTDKTYYIAQGSVSRTGTTKYLPIFRSIANSIKPKI